MVYIPELLTDERLIVLVRVDPVKLEKYPSWYTEGINAEFADGIIFTAIGEDTDVEEFS